MKLLQSALDVKHGNLAGVDDPHASPTFPDSDYFGHILDSI